MKVFIIIGITMMFFLGIFVFFLEKKLYQNQTIKIDTSPKPNSSSSQSDIKKDEILNLAIVDSNPKNGQKSVDLKTNITIKLNKPIKQNFLSFTIFPEVSHSAYSSGNSIEVIFNEKLKEGATYSYSILDSSYSNKPITQWFITKGNVPTPLPHLDESEKIIKKELEMQKKEKPEVFLSNNTPFENEYFKIESAYREDPEGFDFSISFKISDKNLAQKSLDDWLLSIGLNKDQISNLNLIYF